MLKVPFSEALFQPIWTFDSILEIGSFSPARQKPVFFKILFETKMAANRNFKNYEIENTGLLTS